MSVELPIAVALPAEQEVVVGSIARLDGRSSIDPDDSGLTYAWSFTQVPIGSQVESFGFTDLEDDSSIVSFAPDITGSYKVQLIVSDGILFSEASESIIDVRVILVPHHQGFVPDASFIWNYLSDFWTQVPDRRRFETFWSAAIQITASEILKLYQYQYNKSIRDIQETIQKRWISFSPALELDRNAHSFILADDTAGTSAATFVMSPTTGLAEAVQPSYSNVVSIPLTEGDFVETAYGTVASGRLLRVGARDYTITRSNQTFQSINYGTDGESSGSLTFAGSNFTADMEGATLRIIGPSTSALRGDYTIATFTSATSIDVESIPVGLTWAGQTGLTYTVLPAEANHSSAFSATIQVPTGLENQNWRFSSTLVSSQYDFEAQGVSPGDVLEVEVTRVDLGVLSTFFVQVVSVDKNRLGFVLNLEDLSDGVAAEGFTDDIQITLASDLIVGGLSLSQTTGDLVLTQDAATINSTIRANRFKRTYFERLLTSNDEINVGPFSITARPVQVIRNKKMAIDDTIVSIPILQEYIKQPSVIEDGDTIYFLVDDVKTEMGRHPYLLSENLDYIIDDESTIIGSCSVQAGIDEITIPYGDLIDRSIQEGDTIELSLGVTTETFDIRRVLSADTLQVHPLPTITSSAALYSLERRLEGKFLRFIDQSFTKTSPAPTRLWAEVTYFDNSDVIENNFGVLVGVRREDLERIGSGIPYKSAVAGLMYALSNGPTIYNLELSAQILLGLPFAQTAGVIKEINPAFRVREDGSPRYGRILVDGRDRFNNPTGVTNIYFYPQGRQLFDDDTAAWISAVPEFSGIAINPDTEEEYVVGDLVTQFAPLSKGVAIQEYLTDPSWLDRLVAQGDVASQLSKYHSFQVLVNSDLTTSSDIDIVVQFLSKAKAHYVKMTSALLKSLEDFVEIEDTLTFGRLTEFFESSDLGTPTAVKYDDTDDAGHVLSLNGVFYTRYLKGEDLATTYSSSAVSSAAGGFIDARVPLLETWDPPLLRVGDLLVITAGANAGRYPVTAVVDDTHLVLDLDGGTVQTLANQLFIVYRPIKNPIWAGEIVVISGDEVIDTEVGIGTAGVSVGDILVFADLSSLNPVVSKKYTVIEVFPDDTNPTLTLLPEPDEASDTYTAWVIREGLMTSGHIEPPGSSGELFYADVTIFTNYVEFIDAGAHINSWLNLALLRPNDILTIEGIPYTVLRFEPGARQAVVTPAILASATDVAVTVTHRPNRPSTPISVDFLDRLPSDYLELAMVSSLTVGDDAQTTATSTDVTLSVETFSGLLVRPGDYLVLLEGADSLIDTGHGDGVYPIREIVGGTTARLIDQLTATGSFRYGIRRKVPNEG